MIKAWKYVRWLTLLFTIAIEAAVFWIAGPTDNFLLKAQSAWTWEWMGGVAGSLAWLYFEIAIHVFKNANRVKNELDEDGNERIEYETGNHWLRLRRNVIEHRAAWYGIWVPVWLASVSVLYLFGWIIYLAGQFPKAVSAWSLQAQGFFDTHVLDGFRILLPPLDWLLAGIPAGLAGFRTLAREQPGILFGAVVGLWLASYLIERVVRATHAPHLVSRFMHWLEWLAVSAAFFGLLATPWCDWMGPLYTLLPHNGIALIGLLPLGIIAPLFYVPHIAEWLSERYALVTDQKSFDSHLLICGGIFDYDMERISLERLVDARVHQPWWKRPLKAGDLTLVETGGGKEGKVLHDVWDPRSLDRAIKRSIRNRRRHQSGTTD